MHTYEARQGKQLQRILKLHFFRCFAFGNTSAFGLIFRIARFAQLDIGAKAATFHMDIQFGFWVLPQNPFDVALLGLLASKGAREAAIGVAGAAHKCAKATCLEAQAAFATFRADAGVAIAGIFKYVLAQNLVHRVENLGVANFHRGFYRAMEIFPEARQHIFVAHRASRYFIEVGF